MLRFFSQRSGIQKAVLWGFIGILVLGLGIVFALPSGRSYIRSYTPIGESTVAASVDGYGITVSELRQRVANYGRTQTPTGRRTVIANLSGSSLGGVPPATLRLRPA